MNLKDSYNLVVYGDSITKGIIYDSERSRYIPIKENFASIVAEKIKGTVYNAGIYGNTIIRGINKMYRNVIAKTPDIVLIEFGGNDCDFNWDDIALNPQKKHEPNTDVAAFRETLLSMISSLRNENIVPALMTLPPLDARRYFKWIAKGIPSAEENILNWLGSTESIFNWHNSYSEIIADTARETGTLLIDVRSEFLKYSDYSRFLCTDGIHPNRDGHSLIASVLLSFFKENCSFLLHK